MQDMTDQQQPENAMTMKDQLREQAEAKTKELLSQIKSALQLWHVQNEGKAPEIDDIMGMLKPKEEEFDPSEPRILNFKIYYGKNSQNPVYYHDPITSGYFDTQARNWVNERPPLCDHLNERDIGTSDVFDAILHGVMDDEDYSSLEKMELIDDRSKQLWKKLSSLAEQTNAMMKSVEGEDDDKENVMIPPNKPMGGSAEQESSSGSNPFQQIKSGAGVTEQTGEPVSPEPVGENMLEKIISGANQRTGEVAPSEPIDYEIIRNMIQQEIAWAMGEDPFDMYGEEITPEDIANHFKNLEFPQLDLESAPQENEVSPEIHQQVFQRG